jgi:hypothetical protein
MLIKYRRTIVISCIVYTILCLNHFANAQTNPSPSPSPQVARKYDEFGEILYTELIARLDGFAIELHNQPNARGFIITYRSPRDLPGISSRLSVAPKNYLINERGIPAERIVTVDGGIASCLIQELWVVPTGTTPTRRSDAYARDFIDTDSARKFDVFYFPLPQDISAYPSFGDSPEYVESFAAALRREPRALAYVIAYPQYYIENRDEYFPDGRIRRRNRRVAHLDPPGTAQRMLRIERNHLIRTFGISPLRIRTVNGGYRRSRQIELWIVPRGEHPPIPTPNAFPGRRRRGR